MKRNIVRFFSMVMFLAFVATTFSCAEDTECRLKVIVKDVTNQSHRISNATIHIGKESGSVKQDGVSDANGEAFFTFDMEAIMDINVEYIIRDTTGAVVVNRIGKSTVRLVAGELVEKDVLLQQ
ncbi:MAG: hypothetical protein LBO06_04555 [Bacteroidales bacterium]|nr:hypothetical protein [Bacteroidales bacterium]